MYIAFKRNSKQEVESEVVFLGEDVVDAIVNMVSLHKSDKGSSWVMAQIIDESNSQIYEMLVRVIKLMETEPKEA